MTINSNTTNPQNIKVSIEASKPLDVTFYQNNKADINMSCAYIKSGQKELENYINNVSKPNINLYISQKTEQVVTAAANQHTLTLVQSYVENVTKPEISDFAEEQKKPLAESIENAQQHMEQSINEVDSLISTFNYDTAQKQASIAENVSQATASAQSAANSAADASASSATASSAATSAADAATQAENIINNFSSGWNLFDVKWSDHIQNDIRWICADDFTWFSGSIYTAAYNELLSEYNNSAAADFTEGAISGKTTPKGYKIVTAVEESDVLALYNSTGVAWYYILDTDNTRFKLPRTKFNFVGLRNGAGRYVEESLPNISGRFQSWAYQTASYSGAFSTSETTAPCFSASQVNGGCYLDFNASRSSGTYKNGAWVQQRSTEMRLYFYVGNFAKSAIEQTAGLNMELFNSKADLNLVSNKANADLSNISSNIDYVVEKVISGRNYYRLYKSGWCEQGGYIGNAANNTVIGINLFKPFVSGEYIITIQARHADWTNAQTCPSIFAYENNNSSFSVLAGSFDGQAGRISFFWRACGMTR